MLGQKNRRRNLTIILILIGLFIGGGYFGVKTYLKNQEVIKEEILKEKQAIEEREREAQELILEQQRQINETQTSLSELQDKVANIKPTVVYKTEVVQAPEAVKTELNLSAIISQWKNNIAEITCEWQYSNGVAYSRAKGSGFIIAVNGKADIVLTNYHVITDNSLNGAVYPATWCSMKVYGLGEAKVIGSDAPFSGDAIHDIGHIDLKKGATPQSNSLLNIPLQSQCYNPPEIGDRVVILGYPSIGTVGGITATEGIISGIEGDYFVTSAKIDHGNSGGVAVLVKSNCFLGIPTWAKTGEIESLGRILSNKYIFR